MVLQDTYAGPGARGPGALPLELCTFYASLNILLTPNPVYGSLSQLGGMGVEQVFFSFPPLLFL